LCELGDPALLATARRIADAVISSARLCPDGVLTEPEFDLSDADRPAFKGIFVRNLAELDRRLPGRPYHSFLQAQARSAVTHARDVILGGVVAVPPRRRRRARDGLPRRRDATRHVPLALGPQRPVLRSPGHV